MSRTEVPDAEPVRLSAVLHLLGPSVLAAVEDPPGCDPEVSGPVLWDPMDSLPPMRGGILLLVGGSPVNPLLDRSLVAAGHLGYAAAVIKRRSSDLSSTAELARQAGLVLLATADDMSWGTLEALLAGVISSQDGAAALGDTSPGDLFAVANAIAAMADAAVTIEDVSRQVLAYSTIDGHAIDASRRNSILGRHVPGLPEYLAEYQTLSQSADAVFFPAEESGTLARVAMPIRVSGRLLGSIWAIDETGECSARIAKILAQITPTVALHLLRAASAVALERQRRAELLAAKLGMAHPLGGEATARLRDRLPVALLGFGPLPPVGGTWDEQRLTNLIALNAETVRRDASCARMDEGVFVLLPSARRLTTAQLDQFARSTLRAVGTARALDVEINCAYVPFLEAASAIAGARQDITTALRAMRHRGSPSVVDIAEHRHVVVMQQLAESGAADGDRLVPAVRRILDHDLKHNTAYGATLLAHLDFWGDARKAAARLGVHENSQRYRMRRIVDQFGVDLDDPDLRLVAWLQLRTVLSSGADARTFTDAPPASWPGSRKGPPPA